MSANREMCPSVIAEVVLDHVEPSAASVVGREGAVHLVLADHSQASGALVVDLAQASANPAGDVHTDGADGRRDNQAAQAVATWKAEEHANCACERGSGSGAQAPANLEADEHTDEACD
jgi:hypothetical protein